MLNSRLDWHNMQVLDLYSGSGAIVFEFLSRGIDSAIAVDSNFESVKFISSIKQEWNIENLEVVKSDSIRYLQKCHLKFDLIFADPPYDDNDYESLHKEVFEKELLKENAFLILEHGRKMSLESLTGFQFQRSFGNVNFSFFTLQ